MSTKLEEAGKRYMREHEKFKKFIDEKTARGELIMRFGSLPEYKPLGEAKVALLHIALDPASYTEDK